MKIKAGEKAKKSQILFLSCCLLCYTATALFLKDEQFVVGRHLMGAHQLEAIVGGQADQVGDVSNAPAGVTPSQ